MLVRIVRSWNVGVCYTYRIRWSKGCLSAVLFFTLGQGWCEVGGLKPAVRDSKKTMQLLPPAILSFRAVIIPRPILVFESVFVGTYFSSNVPFACLTLIVNRWFYISSAGTVCFFDIARRGQNTKTRDNEKSHGFSEVCHLIFLIIKCKGLRNVLIKKVFIKLWVPF